MHGDTLYFKFQTRTEDWTGPTEALQFTVSGETVGRAPTGVRVLSAVLEYIATQTFKKGNPLDQFSALGCDELDSDEGESSDDEGVFSLDEGSYGAHTMHGLCCALSCISNPIDTGPVMSKEVALTLFQTAWPRLIHACKSLYGRPLLKVVALLTRMLDIWSRCPKADVDLLLVSEDRHCFFTDCKSDFRSLAVLSQVFHKRESTTFDFRISQSSCSIFLCSRDVRTVGRQDSAASIAFVRTNVSGL